MASLSKCQQCGICYRYESRNSIKSSYKKSSPGNAHCNALLREYCCFAGKAYLKKGETTRIPHYDRSFLRERNVVRGY